MSLTNIPFDLPGKIYRSPMPFARFDLDHQLFEAFLEEKITTVVMLIEDGEDRYLSGRDLEALYRQNGMDVLRCPIADFDTPEDTRRLEESLQQVLDKAGHGESIAVHCFAGRGRTGLFLALLARRIMGVDGQTAISYLRRYFPAVETASQENLVISYKSPT